MTSIMGIAAEHNLLVIEDAAQGIGTRHGDTHVGTIGDLGCISFFADKTITMGEGGVVLTNNQELADKLRYFKNQGRRDRGSFIHEHVGYNFRVTDLQAAVGVIQMERLDAIIARKKEIESSYQTGLSGLPVEFLPFTPRGERVPFRINIFVDQPARLIEHLESSGIGVRRVFYPLNRQPCFGPQNSRFMGDCSVSLWAFEHGISLPSGISLTNDDIAYVCDSIRSFY
jgi:perosamine synthetase